MLKTAGEFTASGKAEAAGEAPATRTWSWVSVTPRGPGCSEQSSWVYCHSVGEGAGIAASWGTAPPVPALPRTVMSNFI